MNNKDIFTDLSKKISWLSNKNFISDMRTIIDESLELLDKGLPRTCAKQLKQTIDVCEGRKKEKDKDFWWIYSMSKVLYAQSFSRYGKKIDMEIIDESKKIATENGFYDVLFWIHKTQLDFAINTGRVSEFANICKELDGCLNHLLPRDNYQSYILSLLSREAIDRGAYPEAKKFAEELLDLSKNKQFINFQVFAQNLLGRIYLETEKLDDALIILSEAMEFSKKNNCEQQIPAMCNYAFVCLLRDDLEEAKKILDIVVNKIDRDFELKDTIYYINFKRLQAQVEIKEKNYVKAKEILNQALALSSSLESPKEEGKTLIEMGKSFQGAKEINKAVLSFEEASAKFIIINNSYCLSTAKILLKEIKIGEKMSAKDQSLESEEVKEPSLGKEKVLDGFMKIAIGNLDLDVVLNNVVEHIMGATSADRGFVVLLDEEGNLYSQVVHTKQKAEDDKGDKIRQFSRSITDRVLTTKKSVLIDDVQGDQALATSQSITGLDIRSAVCVPLQQESEIIGLIYIDKQALDGGFGEKDLRLVESLAEYATIAVNNAQMHFGIKKKLETTQEQLIHSEKMATIGILAGGVAHEINTPLGTILNNTELLMMDELTEDQKESLEMIKQGTLRCKTIVEQLLKYSRKTSVEFEEVDINAVIQDACIILEHQFSVQGIEIQKIFGEVQMIQGNPTELSQVVTNLLVNARDAIVERKITQENQGKIFIKSIQEEAMITLEVTDNGCGISEELMSKIYDPFYTSKQVGQGTGLGLSIVQKIIERHGGRMEVQSEVNKGTVITIKFLI